MKIIQTDNFNNESVSDNLVAQHINCKEYGECMVEALNTKFSGEYVPYFFQLKEDDYKLYEFSA